MAAAQLEWAAEYLQESEDPPAVSTEATEQLFFRVDWPTERV